MVKLVADNLRDPAPRLRRRQPSARSGDRARKFTPARADLSELLHRAIPALERMPPAKKKHGHGTDEWRDRDQIIIETIRLVCRKYEFDATRNPASVVAPE